MDVFEIYGQVGGWFILCLFMIVLPAIVNFILTMSICIWMSYDSQYSGAALRQLLRDSWACFPFKDDYSILPIFFIPLMNILFTGILVFANVAIVLVKTYDYLDDRFGIQDKVVGIFRKLCPKKINFSFISKYWNKLLDVKIK